MNHSMPIVSTLILGLVALAGCAQPPAGAVGDGGPPDSDASAADEFGRSEQSLSSWGGGGPSVGVGSFDDCEERCWEQYNECLEQMEDIAGGPGPVVDQVCGNQVDDCIAGCTSGINTVVRIQVRSVAQPTRSWQ